MWDVSFVFCPVAYSEFSISLPLIPIERSTFRSCTLPILLIFVLRDETTFLVTYIHTWMSEPFRTRPADMLAYEPLYPELLSKTCSLPNALISAAEARPLDLLLTKFCKPY